MIRIQAPFVIAALALLAACVSTMEKRQPAPLHWAAYYGNSLPAKAFAPYDLVVFDRQYHPNLAKLRKGVVALAYVSIGEVHGDAPEKDRMEKARALLFRQEKWNSHAVDLMNAEWKKQVLEAVADAKKQGFAGVMLDTVESPLHWASSQSPEQQRAMEDAAVALIYSIREAQPDMKLMLNRGFDILPRVASKIDMVLAESIFSQPDEKTGQFKPTSPTSFNQAVIQLRNVAAIAPRLQVLTLDYWNPDDVVGITRIYDAQRAAGFAPYVSTPDLRRLWPEPYPIRPPEHARAPSGE